MPKVSLSGRPLHPPTDAECGAAALTISVGVAMALPREQMTNQSAARTTLYDPSNLAPECFFQLAHLLDSEYHADKAKLVESLRFVADTLVQEGWAGLPGDV